MELACVRLFGSPALIDERGEHLLRAERRDQLLVYLACCNRWVSRDQLADLFWADRGQRAARSNLRYVVLQVRRAEIQGVEVRGDALRWCIDNDMQRFERAIATRDWQAALDAHAGALLDGFEIGAPPPFAEWLSFERARIAAAWQDALAARFAQLHDDPPACAALAAQVLLADPLNEDALAAHLRALRALGRPAEAQRIWGAYVARLAADHGLEPTAELRALAAPLRSAPEACRGDAAKSAAVSDCIGRRLELAQIGDLLGEVNCRLLTLTGPGGVGKSTLARAALPLASAQFADGSAWIGLEDLAQVDEVAPRIAARVNLQLTGTEAALVQVTRHLRERQMLLVFDNAEHLSGFDHIAETLLHECERLKLLATSRVRIAIGAEWLLPLEGLPVPDRDERDVDVLRAFDAVRLFELRAHALSPAFGLPAHASDVVELAHAVEGLPLALELAAAWTRLLPVREIVRELTRSLDLLDAPGGSGARDRSLRASFEHSWHMLTPIEREVLPRLGVFVGSFSRAAAEHVAQAPLAVLGALVDKSLLRSAGDGRFSLHSLVRQYGAQQLTDSEAVLARHADYYTRLLARFANYQRVDQKAALVEIELELENARAAWKWAIGQEDAARLEAMALPLLFFFDTKGRWHEGTVLMQEGFDAIDGADHAGGPDAIRQRGSLAALSRALALLHFRAGHYACAETNARRAAALYRAAGNTSGMLASLNVGGLVLWRRGQLLEAKRHFEEALTQAAATQEVEEAPLLIGLAVVEKSFGRYERALALYGRALALCRTCDDLRGTALVLHNIGNLHRVRKDHAAAVACLSEGLHLCEQHGFEATRVGCLLNLGLTLLDMGELERAGPIVERAAVAAQQSGVGWWMMGVQFALCRIAIAHGDLASSIAHLRIGLCHARESGDVSQQIDGITCGGRWRAARGERSAAAILFAWGAAQANDEKRAEARDLLAQLALSVEEFAVAERAAAALALDVAVDAILSEPTTAIV